MAINDILEDPAALERLRLAMKGFELPTALTGREGNANGGKVESRRYEVSRDRLPLAGLPYAILRLLGFADLGRAEKTAWYVPFFFEGKPCALASEKFGLRLYVTLPAGASDDDAKQVSDLIIRRLDKAQRVLERDILRPFGARQFARGNVTIRNQYHALTGMFEYFRGSAQAAFDGRGRIQPNLPGAGRLLWHRETEGFYNTVAMVTAYFSRLEHTLVLALPFVGFDSATTDLMRFIGDRWREKFQKLFDIKSDQVAKRLHDELHRISEEFRNTYSHGGFDKDKASVAFQVPGVGALPGILSGIRDRPYVGFLPVEIDDFAQICAVLDKVDTWLQNGPAHYGIEWAESGLDVRYDPAFLKEVRVAMASDASFAQFLDHEAHIADVHANMDY